jgi:galactokinase
MVTVEPGLTSRIAAAFEERAGRSAEGVWAAPGRVNLIGEHTDYNDGFVLPIAIGRATFAAVARRKDDRLRCWSLQEGAAEDVSLDELGPSGTDGWAAYPQGVAWVLRDEGVELGGADVVVDTTLPQGSGLSSSAALECAVALALSELFGGALEPATLALAAQRAETEVVGVPSGAMDQMAAMLGRAGHALFLDTRSLEIEQIPLDLDEADLVLIVIDTRAPRRLAEGAYAERRDACEAAARALGVRALRDASAADVEAAAETLGDVRYRRARHVVSENGRVLEAVAALRERRLERLGPLLNGSHRSLRFDFEVSSRALDTAVTAALSAGALGARMTGAGFGGCALALVPRRQAPRVEDEVRAAFEAAGLGEPDLFPVTPSGGARRVA